MKVWILVQGWPDGEEDHLAVFATEEYARDFVRAMTCDRDTTVIGDRTYYDDGHYLRVEPHVVRGVGGRPIDHWTAKL